MTLAAALILTRHYVVMLLQKRLKFLKASSTKNLLRMLVKGAESTADETKSRRRHGQLSGSRR